MNIKETKHCRICLKIKNDIFSIYDYRKNEYLPTVIYNISGVKILKRLEPEAKICPQCATAVLVAQTIILRCQDSEQYLGNQKLKKRRLQNEVENSLASKVNFEEMQLEDEHEYIEYIEEQEDSEEEQHPEQSIVLNDINVETLETIESVENATTPKNFTKTNMKHKKERKSNVTKTKTQAFSCDYCDFQAKIGKLLIEHLLVEHEVNDPNIYKCTLCTERFSWKPKLYRHIQVDHKTLPEDKKFLCNECGKAYTREVHLIEHTKQRHGPRRFKCADPNCEQTFNRVFTLRRHFLAAHGNKTRYHCADCDKYFKIYDLWKYHNEVVHKNETVYCPRCGYPFRYKEKLEEHLEKETCKRSIIPCQYCQRRFTSKAGLREHLKKIHLIQ